jgi:Leucine-rich repeat (LRR) protein
MDKFLNKSTVEINLDELPTKEIPEEIGELISATGLTIQLTQPTGNWTVYPPLSWYETRELKEPFLKLPSSIGQLESLKSLQLSNLDIHELPESISQLKNLEFLDLSMNKLDLSNELPKLNELSNLKHLRILGNHFEDEEMKEFQRQNPNIKVEYKDETHPNKR